PRTERTSTAVGCGAAASTASAIIGWRWPSPWPASLRTGRCRWRTSATCPPRSRSSLNSRQAPDSRCAGGAVRTTKGRVAALLDPEVDRHCHRGRHRPPAFDRGPERPLADRFAGGAIERAGPAAAFDLHRSCVALRIHLDPQQYRPFLAQAQRVTRILGLHARQRLGGAVGSGACRLDRLRWGAAGSVVAV